MVQDIRLSLLKVKNKMASMMPLLLGIVLLHPLGLCEAYAIFLCLIFTKLDTAIANLPKHLQKFIIAKEKL
jgi:hypothetical protein